MNRRLTNPRMFKQILLCLGKQNEFSEITKLEARCIQTQSVLFQDEFNQPLSANEMPRSGGIASFARLPIQSTAEGNL